MGSIEVILEKIKTLKTLTENKETQEIANIIELLAKEVEDKKVGFTK